MNALKWFKLRTTIMLSIYYVLLLILSLYLYIVLYSLFVPMQSKLPIHYSFDKTACNFEVVELVPMRGLDNSEGVEVVLKGPGKRFSVEIFDAAELESIDVGTKYKGYEVKYTAYMEERLIDTYVNNIFYLQQGSDNPLTYAQFQINTEQTCLEKYTQDYNARYIRDLLIFLGIYLLVTVVLFKWIYAMKCIKFIRKSTQKKESNFCT